MGIFPIGVTQDTTTTNTATSGNSAVSKDEFLNLFVTQLQNQDPLSPMDSSQFSSQLAQFSSLEQLQNVNSNLQTLYGYQQGLFNENLSSFIGKNVKVNDNSIDLVEGNTNQLTFNLDESATGIYASIYNSQGEMVREITQLGTYSSGENSITWDGLDDNGKALESGIFAFEVQAVGNSGTFTGTPTRNFTINSIGFLDGNANLRSGEKTIDINNVIGVGGV